MRVLRFDAGERWDDPNAYWGDPSYVLEPGDPGYVDPNPPAPAPFPGKTKKHKAMNNNEIPQAERPILARSEDAADGCAALQNDIPLKMIREADLRLVLTRLKGAPTATPPVLGLIYQYKQADLALAAANAGRREKDEEGRAYLTTARASLISILGSAPSPEWALAGFTNAPNTNSNAVPRTQEGRLQCLSALAVYLSQHPTYEIPAGGPRAEVTAAKTQALHDQLSACRTLANSASKDQDDALKAKNAALRNQRRQLIALVDELQLRLSDDDARWEVFGLNIPANPRPPEPAEDLVLSSAGLGRIIAEWTPGTRSDDDRILIMIVGVDADYSEYGKSGGDGEELLKNLPSGATVKIKIISLNGSLEAPTGPEAQIVVD
jgi:hypothetical protein